MVAYWTVTGGEVVTAPTYHRRQWTSIRTWPWLGT
jgi:hypothetical protein